MPDRVADRAEAKCDGIPIAWLWQNRPAAFRSFEELRRFSVNGGLSLLVALLVFVVLEATFEDTIIIEPVSVPKALDERGYTGTAISRRLIDNVIKMNEEATTSKAREQYGSDSQFSEASAIRLPSSSVSIQTVVTLLRNSFNVAGNRISGEITIEPPLEEKPPADASSNKQDARNARQFALTVHLVKSGKRDSRTRRGEDLDKVLRLAALDILEKFDGAVLASYLIHRSETDPAIPKDELVDIDDLLDRLMKSADRRQMPWLLNIRGLRLDKQGRHDEAEALYRRAITEFDRRFSPAYVNLAILMQNGTIEGGKEGAVALYRQALRFNPRYLAALNNLGTILSEQEDYDGAIDNLQKAIAADPNNPRVHLVYYHCARAFELRAARTGAEGDYDRAMWNYQKATEINPKLPDVYNRWGDLLDRKKDYAGAIAKYRKATAAEPHSSAGFFNLATALDRRAQSVGKAKDDGPEAARKAIENGMRRDYAEAAANFDKATQLNSHHVMAYNGWGLTLEHQADAFGKESDYDEAIEKYRIAIQRIPEFAEPYHNLARLLEKRGRTSEAREIAEKAEHLAHK
jgi:tetratricopeptide (TPR) repeat protein